MTIENLYVTRDQSINIEPPTTLNIEPLHQSINDQLLTNVEPTATTNIEPTATSDQSILTYHEFLNLMEVAESSQKERQLFINTISTRLKSSREFTFVLHKLHQRGYLSEILQIVDFKEWDMCKLSFSTLKLILKYALKNNCCLTSMELKDYFLKLRVNQDGLTKFCNFYAIRNISLTIMEIDAIVLVTKEILIMNELFDNLLLVWSDKDFIDSGTMEYHTRIAVAIVLIIKHNDGLDKRRFVGKFLNGVPLYLEASRQQIRLMGMIISEMLANFLTPDTKLELVEKIPKELSIITELQKLKIITRDCGEEGVLIKKEPIKIVEVVNTRLAIRSEEFLPISAKDITPRLQS